MPATPTPTPTPVPVATPGPTPTPAPKPSGELRIALDSLGREMLDPVKAARTEMYQWVLLFDWLVEADVEGNLAPERSLAYKWEIATDLKTYTLYIRKGVKFHNGDELTPEDVKFSLERFIGPGSVTTLKATVSKAINSIALEAPDKVIIKLNYPDPMFIYYLSIRMAQEGMVMPKKYIQEKGDAYFAQHPVGTGPYRFVEQVLGSYIKFEALDSHWALGVPKFKYVYFLKVPEEGTRVAMLKAGEADIIGISRPRALELEKAGFGLAKRPGMMDVEYSPMRISEPDNPMRDVRVRKALSLAINRKEIADFVFSGYASPAPDASTAGMTWAVGYQPREATPFDPKKARELLAEAGYPGGKGLTVKIYAGFRAVLPEAKALAEAIAGYWSAIGVNSEILLSDYAAYRGKIVDNTIPYPSVTLMFFSNAPALMTGVDVMAGKDTVLQGVRPRDPKLEALIIQGLGASTLEESKNKYQETISYMLDIVQTIGLSVVDEVLAVNPKKIKVAEWNLGKNIQDMGLKFLVKR